MSDSRLSWGMGHCVSCVCVCVSSSSCAQGGTPAEVHLHMWVRVWLRARAECCVCVCVSGWNMWVFAGEWDDFYRHWFTRGRPCSGLFKTCQVPGLGNDAQLQDHAKAPWGLAGVADAGRVRKSMVFLCWQKNLRVSVCPQKVLVMHLLSELSLTWHNPSGFHHTLTSKSTRVTWLIVLLFVYIS